MHRFILYFFIIVNFYPAFAYGCQENEPILKVENLLVFYDANLQDVMREVVLKFNNTHHHLKVNAKAYGSRELAYRVMEARDRPDLLFVADPGVFEDLLIPEYADWYIKFGENSLVLAFSKDSKYAAIINENNWQEIISKDEVRLARPEENLFCLGYRTLFVWQLAQDYYKKPGLYDKLYKNSQGYVYASEDQPLFLIESQDLDYAFVYLNTAKSKNFRYLQLPPEINLGQEDMAGLYQKASVRLTGKKRQEFIQTLASPICYAFTVPKNILYAARKAYIIEFLNHIFSKKEKDILEKYSFSLTPLSVVGEKIPPELKGYVQTNH